jgi:hypothetical protein
MMAEAAAARRKSGSVLGRGMILHDARRSLPAEQQNNSAKEEEEGKK